jgi:hypothetical protein
MVYTILSIGFFWSAKSVKPQMFAKKMFTFPIFFYNVRHILYKFHVHYMISVPFYNVYNLYILWPQMQTILKNHFLYHSQFVHNSWPFFYIIIVIFVLLSEYPQKNYNCILGLLLHLFDFLNMCCHVRSEGCICFCLCKCN